MKFWNYSSATQLSFRKIITWTWLLLVSAVAVRGLYKVYVRSVGMVNGDAEWIYLPGGRKLLEDPLIFITTDILSYSVAPLGYVWSAVWGGNELAIKLANCGLFIICIFLVWRIALRLGGTVAAVSATAIWVTTHTLLHAIPQVLTEAMYMFGFLLLVFGLVEAIVSGNPRIRWFAAASLGLTITLLSRPVLQYVVLGVLALMAAAYAAWRIGALKNTGSHVKVVFRRATYALLLALVLPLLVIAKNGIYFGSWSIGTGAGAGLYYGVHPLHMGEEPYYTNFQYDVGHTASTINPATRGNLEIEADRWQKQIAVHMITQTSFLDNLRFFASKARAWLLYSPIENHFDPKWREKRQLQVILLCAGVWLLCQTALFRGRRAVVEIFEQLIPGHHARSGPHPVAWTPSAQAKGMFFCCVALVLLTGGMIAQFLPILYNARYNGAFLDPLFVILGSVALAMLTRHVRILFKGNEAGQGNLRNWPRAAGQIAFLLLLLFVHRAAGDWALRHERLSLDPHRLGPAAVVLNGDAFGPARVVGMEAKGDNGWVTRDYLSELAIRVNIPPGLSLSTGSVYEAIWRIRLQMRGDIPSACRDVAASYSQPDSPTSTLPPRVFLSRDGKMHSYALSAGQSMRPRESGELVFKFTCPAGIKIDWGGAELLRSTLAEASRELVLHGNAFSPYQSHEPRLPEKKYP